MCAALQTLDLLEMDRSLRDNTWIHIIMYNAWSYYHYVDMLCVCTTKPDHLKVVTALKMQLLISTDEAMLFHH